MKFLTKVYPLSPKFIIIINYCAPGEFFISQQRMRLVFVFHRVYSKDFFRFGKQKNGCYNDRDFHISGITVLS